MLQQLVSLLDGAHLAAPDVLPSVVASAARVLGWTSQIYLIDYPQRWLVPLAAVGTELPAAEAVDSTLAGRAFRTVELVQGGDDHEWRVWVPLLDGVERLGVVDIRFPLGSDLDRGPLRDQIRWFSHLVGYLVASKSPYGDSFQRARSADQRSVASDLIWSLLPPLTMGCDRLLISGLLEPAEKVAGDVFDYAVDDGIGHVAIFDATGHDLHSSAIGGLALASYRNGRHQQLDLPSAAARIDSTLIEYAVDTYATGLLGQLELDSGIFRYVNAGHPSPLLLRDGKVIKSLDEGRRILFGFPNRTAATATEQLEPGDVIVLYTDGVIEARDEARNFFGIDRFIDVLERRFADRQFAPETLRRIVHTVLEYQHGTLQDDASILFLEWATASARAPAAG